MKSISKNIAKIGKEIKRNINDIDTFSNNKDLKVVGNIGVTIAMPWLVDTLHKEATSNDGWVAKNVDSSDKESAKTMAGFLIENIHKGASQKQEGYYTAKNFITDKFAEGINFVQSQNKREVEDYDPKESNETIEKIAAEASEERRKSLLSTNKNEENKKLEDADNDRSVVSTTVYDDIGSTVGYNKIDNATNQKLKQKGANYGGVDYIEEMNNSELFS